MDRASMGMELESPCGPRAPCRAKLEAMKVTYQKELQELEEKHANELKELEKLKDKQLQEEIQTAAKGKAEWGQCPNILVPPLIQASLQLLSGRRPDEIPLIN